MMPFIELFAVCLMGGCAVFFAAIAGMALEHPEMEKRKALIPAIIAIALVGATIALTFVVAVRVDAPPCATVRHER